VIQPKPVQQESNEPALEEETTVSQPPNLRLPAEAALSPAVTKLEVVLLALQEGQEYQQPTVVTSYRCESVLQNLSKS
jgi:hypothetical protein